MTPEIVLLLGALSVLGAWNLWIARRMEAVRDEFQRLGGAMLRDLQTAEDRAEARTKRTEIAAARLSAVTRWHDPGGTQ